MGGEPSVVVFDVPDMDCVSCAQRITDRLQQIEGIDKIEPRVVAKDLRIEFDPTRVVEATIAEAVRSLGYTVVGGGREHEPRAASPALGTWISIAAAFSFCNARCCLIMSGLMPPYF